MRFPSSADLSNEQLAVLGLPFDRSWLVTGPPGTGKTVVAIHRAQTLANANKDFKILTFYRALRMYMSNALVEVGAAEDGIEGFFSWFRAYFAELTGAAPPMLGEWSFDWTAVHEALNDVAPISPIAGTLLIDEGQDLPSGFYVFARLLCDHLMVFADENQRIFDDQVTLSELKLLARIPDDGVFELNVNYRNTREIALLAREFYAGAPTGIPDLPSRTGKVPVMRRFDTWSDSLERIRKWADGHDSEQIGVFLPKGWVVKRWSADLKEKLDSIPVQAYYNPRRGRPPRVDFDKPGIVVTTLQSAKGLEFDTVFVPELNQWWHDPSDPVTQALLYVLTSRARSRLEFHYSGKGEPKVLQLFPGGGVIERRMDD